MREYQSHRRKCREKRNQERATQKEIYQFNKQYRENKKETARNRC